MSMKEFKYIKGALEAGKPADICFYSDVSYWRVADFLWEFTYLKDDVRPSEIRIHINSAGGNCIDGISVFSAIQNCDIPVTTINDGLAASMASIIWSAGDKCMMKDYALLMIHNPFIEGGKPNEVTEAFKKQLRIIYTKRFGLTEDKVTEIMDGKPGEDGTWYTASEAVDAGFIGSDCIIETPQAVKDKVAACINALGRGNIKGISAVIDLVDGISKPNGAEVSINDKMNEISKINNNTNKMAENEIKVVAALLGLTGERATEANVSSRVNELVSAERNLAQAQADLKAKETALAEAETKINGLNASVDNLTKNYNEAKAKLDAFEKAEAAKRQVEIEAMVDSAINACKISKESRDSWVEQAKANLELVKKTLDSIPARENIPQHIADEPENHGAAQAGMKSEMEKIQEKVKAVVGENFAFEKPIF